MVKQSSDVPLPAPAAVKPPASTPQPAPRPSRGQPGSSSAPVPAPKAVRTTAAPRNGEPTPQSTLPHSDNDTEAEHHSFLWFAAVPSWLTSMVLHIIALLILALLTLDISTTRFNNDLTIGRPDAASEDIELFEEESPSEVSVDLDALSADVPVLSETEITSAEPLVSEAKDLDAAPIDVQLSPIGFEAAQQSDLMQEVGAFMGAGLEGSGAAERSRLVREAGGTEGSEAAVKRALLWLKRHQNNDGSWSFFHLAGQCPCPGHGEMAQARIGATAMALLPFLGAGNTHREGNYQKEVNSGLYFLLSQQQSNGALWEQEGNMYSHGMASIVLCEAYAMTKDNALRKPAQASLDFIAWAQDPIGGGWRYNPRIEPGDTSVVGWQLMALKSGHMAGLYVNPQTIAGAIKFLNSVQSDGGSAYGYMAPGKANGTTAIGLLCRMYLGWKHENPALIRGVQRLSKSGPSDVNLYFNYYATQVMRHYEGNPWEKWNKKMRDSLVQEQAKSGHTEGSWYMGREYTDKGGRLYCTAMATMILEVYYRHMPIYGKKAAEEEFPL